MKGRDLIGFGIVGFVGTSAIAGERGSTAEFDFKVVTQQLVDAIAPGRAGVWAEWLHPDFVSTDENGTLIDRQGFLAGMTLLPPGASGDLRLFDFAVRNLGQMAIATYVIDEIERFHGEELRCQYRNTDSWVLTPSGWCLAATQEIALRKDPPAVELTPAEWSEYAGRYALADGVQIEVRSTATGAALHRSSGVVKTLQAEARDVLFIPGEPRYRYMAARDSSGAVARLAERREAWDLPWIRVA